MYVFISYSGKDSKKVTDIQEALKRVNVEYFAFESNIRPGQKITEEVLAAIKRATHMLLVASHANTGSSWVWYEVGVARGVSLGTGRDIRLIPYKTDETVVLPDFIRDICHVESLNELVRYLKNEKTREKDTPPENLSSLTLGDQLEFYGFRATVKMIDFCKIGYNPTNISFRLLGPIDAKPPKQLANDFQLKKGEWEKKQEKEIVYDHNDLVGLKKYCLVRAGTEEKQGLKLDVFTGSYVSHRAAVDVFRGLPSELKKDVIHDSVHTSPLHGGHGFFGRILAVSVALVTGDRKIIFQRRSKSVAIDPGLIMCGIGEGMKQSDLQDGNNKGVAGAYKTAIRGLHEEFGVEIENPMECLRLTGFCLNRELFEWYILGTIDLSKTRPNWDEQAIRAAISKDGFLEIDDIYFVPYQSREVFKFLRDHSDEMVNYGTAAAICSMVADWEFNRESLRDAALQALESRSHSIGGGKQKPLFQEM